MLDFYYWQQYYTFANNYGAYLSYLMDTSKGLDEQAYSDTETWQQAFLTGAADMFHSITALNLEADAAGFELSEEDQAQLDAIAQSLDATADYYGMESGLAYLQASFGPKATVEDYVAFARDNLRASRYLEKLMDEMEFTDAEISDYYDQNADTYAENRVEKIDKPMVNVRHILVMPAEQNEDGTYTDEAWAEAEQKAQELLDSWKAGPRRPRNRLPRWQTKTPRTPAAAPTADSTRMCTPVRWSTALTPGALTRQDSPATPAS